MISENMAVIDALTIWLQQAQAPHLAQFGAHSAAQYALAVEHSHAMAHHPCIGAIHDNLQQAVLALKSTKKQDAKTQMRTIDTILSKCAAQETELKQLLKHIDILRRILLSLETDLQYHQTALSAQLPKWRSEVTTKNPLDTNVVRNDTADRRLSSIVALVQSCHSSNLQMQLMHQQLTHLLENLSTLRQVTYPIWQQKAINRTMLDDQAFLNALQLTLSQTGDMTS